MSAAEVSAVRSWSQQHVEWDRFSVGVMMTAREMLGSDGYKSLVFENRTASPWSRRLPAFRYLLNN